jgi:hypothetical protein
MRREKKMLRIGQELVAFTRPQPIRSRPSGGAPRFAHFGVRSRATPVDAIIAEEGLVPPTRAFCRGSRG